MKRHTFLFFITSICILFAAQSNIFADKYSAKEVKEIIKQVEQAVDKYNEAGADKWAGKELGFVEGFIKKAKAFLDDGEEDFAWYEINKAKAYFRLIDAKKEYQAVEKEYKSVQTK